MSAIIFSEPLPPIKIIQVPFDILNAVGHIEMARKAGVTIRQRDLIFAVDGVLAFGCIRMLRTRGARLCGCFVGKEFRRKGYGKALVLHRLEFLRANPAVRVVDTYAFRKKLFLSLGFEEVAGYKIGTTLLRLRISR